MNFLLAPLRWLLAWVDRAVCAWVALIFALAPVYSDQYLAHLAETRDRAGTKIALAKAEARALNLSPEVYLEQLRQGDSARRDSLELLAYTLERHQRYTEAYEDLAQRNEWWQPLYLLFNHDLNLRTSLEFVPQLDFSLREGVFAAVGLTLAWLLMALVRWPLRPRRPKSPDT